MNPISYKDDLNKVIADANLSHSNCNSKRLRYFSTAFPLACQSKKPPNKLIVLKPFALRISQAFAERLPERQ